MNITLRTGYGYFYFTKLDVEKNLSIGIDNWTQILTALFSNLSELLFPYL